MIMVNALSYFYVVAAETNIMAALQCRALLSENSSVKIVAQNVAKHKEYIYSFFSWAF